MPRFPQALRIERLLMAQCVDRIEQRGFARRHLSRSAHSGDQGQRDPTPYMADPLAGRLHKVIFRAAIHQGQHRATLLEEAAAEDAGEVIAAVDLRPRHTLVGRAKDAYPAVRGRADQQGRMDGQ